MPSYLIKSYLVSRILFSHFVRGAFGAVKQLENASETAVKGRKQEDNKHDMLRRVLEINVHRGEEIGFSINHVCVESHSAMFVRERIREMLPFMEKTGL